MTQRNRKEHRHNPACLREAAHTRGRSQIRQARRDSNPHHPDLESGALPFELLAYIPQGWGPRNLALSLSGLPVDMMLTTEAAVLPEFESLRRAALVLRRRVIAAPALDTRQGHQIPHGILLTLTAKRRLPASQSRRLVDEPRVDGTHSQARISLTTPAPTVRPPSRIAKRNSFSNAIGVINCTSTPTLSPGITISVPEGNVTTPVTSVVRK